MSRGMLAQRNRFKPEPQPSIRHLASESAAPDLLPASTSSVGHTLGGFAIQRCGPVPCDCSEEERAAFEERHESGDEREHVRAAGSVARTIQRAPDDVPPPSDGGGGASTLGGNQPNDATPLNAGANGSTTIHAPTMAYNTYSAPTLAALNQILPEEVGSVTFDFTVSASGDPITSARLNVTQVMTMPRWTEYNSQCQPVKRAWDSFYSALRNHEDGHVTRDNQQFAGKHARFIGQAQSDTQTVSDQLRTDVQAVQDAYDSSTDHGRTQNPPTVLDTSPTCAPSGATSELGASDLGGYADTNESTDTSQTMQAARADNGGGSLDGDAVATGVQRVVGAGGGQPLDGDTRSFMESRFGHNFGNVRVHTDDEAARSAASARSLAYTVGSDIVFAADRYAPQTSAGRHLLAHELTHVVQQSAGPVAGTALGNGLTISDPSDSYEQAAEATAHSIMRGESIATTSGVSGGGQAQRQLQRAPDSANDPPAILTSSISPDYARGLSDAELERQVSLLRTTLAGMNQSDDLYHGGQENLSVLETEVSQRSLGKLAEQGDEFDPYSDPYQQYCSATETLASMGKSVPDEPQGVGIPAGQLVVVDDTGQLQLVADDGFIDLSDDVFPTLSAIADASQGATLPDIGLGDYFEQIVLWNDGRALITPMVGADMSLLFMSGIGMGLDGAGGVTGIEKPWESVQTDTAKGLLTGNLYQLGSHPISQFNGIKLAPGSRVRFSDPAFALSPVMRGKAPKIDTRFLTIFNKNNKKYYAWDHHEPVGKIVHPEYHINSEGMHAEMKVLLGKGSKGHYEVPPNLLGQAKGLRYIRVGGRVCLVIGIIIDGALMVEATNESINRGDARPVIAQAIRTVGGWGGAWAGAKAGCAIGAAAGVETGPGMALTCLAGGVIGGFAGYFIADTVADAIYED